MRKYNDINPSLNPVALLHWLKTREIIAPPYYLHIYQDRIEIGWQAKAQLICLNGEKTETHTWVQALKQLCDEAARDHNKAFGYLGFDACDRTQGFSPDNSTQFPLVQFFIPEHRLCIRNKAIEYRCPDHHLVGEIAQAPISPLSFKLPRLSPDAEFSEEAFMHAVVRAKQRLSEDLSKVVLSRYLGFNYNEDLLALFNEYCLKQRYTDAILMDFGEVSAAIASPELLMQMEAGVFTANPLAGTRNLGGSALENNRIEQSLLCDRKELAEHVLGLRQMLMELQPCCETEALVIKKFLNIRYQNNLMHLSSELADHLRNDAHCVDAMLALFPSVMVSGVPKPAAIRCIRDMEYFPRGLFAGTVGWVAGRDCRFFLTIRSLCKYGSRLFGKNCQPPISVVSQVLTSPWI